MHLWSINPDQKNSLIIFQEDRATFYYSLKAHISKAHNLVPKEYYKRYGLDPKKLPLVCKEYSEKRRKLAIEKGLGAARLKEAS